MQIHFLIFSSKMTAIKIKLEKQTFRARMSRRELDKNLYEKISYTLKYVQKKNTICTYLNGSGVRRYPQGPDESELLERRVQARHTVAVSAVVAALLLTSHHLFIIAHVL